MRMMPPIIFHFLSLMGPECAFTQHWAHGQAHQNQAQTIIQFEANTPLLILERKRIQSFEVNRELCVIFVSEDILYRNVRFLRIAKK